MTLFAKARMACGRSLVKCFQYFFCARQRLSISFRGSHEGSHWYAQLR